MSEPAQTSPPDDWRSLIHTFIRERRDTKLNGADPAEYPDVVATFSPLTWLEDAARRVSQIKAVTHVLKATHPDAKGTSLHIPVSSMHQHAEVGSHSLSGPQPDDIVGNAAALDVYKLLKLERHDKRLLDALVEQDSDTLAALHPEPEIAQTWASAFTGLLQPGTGTLSSHALAKQLYWCADEDPVKDTSYHLLQPLFSSVLAHAVHADIQNTRFGEDSVALRQAKRDDKPADGEYREYRNLVTRKMGGTKPQNISQLNSERRGINYLLASLPPQWDNARPRSLRNLTSVFDNFIHFEGVKELLTELVSLLKPEGPSTLDIRQERARIEQDLADAMLMHGESLAQGRGPGWTRQVECQLPLCQQIWLDPERAELKDRSGAEGQEDKDFRHAMEWKDWPDEVASLFAYWLNAQLVKAGFPVGVDEAKHWAKQVFLEVEYPATMRRRLLTPDETEDDHV